MKRTFALLSMALLVSLAAAACVHQVVVRDPVPYPAAPAPSRYPADAGEAVLTFYDDLEPYGSWIRVDGPGWVWQPAGVAAGWRPYTEGHWVYTDYGWTWAADEDWGWAAYHYGRWHHSPRHGWVWVPGSDWGPAWVSWNSSGDWVGWAPLPWQVEWRAGVGLEWGHVDVRVAIEPAWWCFLPLRHITDPRPARYFAPVSRNVSLVRITHNVTNYTIIDQRVVNQSLQVNLVSKAIGRPVPRVKVRHDERPRGARGSEIQGDELIVYRPARRGADRTSVETPGQPQRTRDEETTSPPPRPRAEEPARTGRPNRYRFPQDARKSNRRQPPAPPARSAEPHDQGDEADAPPAQAPEEEPERTDQPSHAVGENQGRGPVDRGQRTGRPVKPGRPPAAPPTAVGGPAVKDAPTVSSEPAAKSGSSVPIEPAGKPQVSAPPADRSTSGGTRTTPARPEARKPKKKSVPQADDDSKSKASDSDDSDKDSSGKGKSGEGNPGKSGS